MGVLKTAVNIATGAAIGNYALGKTEAGHTAAGIALGLALVDTIIDAAAPKSYHPTTYRHYDRFDYNL